MIIHCYLEYDPERQYTRQEMIDLITPQRELLSFFASTSREQRCLLGLDFDGYDAADGSVPVYVMDEAAARVFTTR